jgi:hypothetical protein
MMKDEGSKGGQTRRTTTKVPGGTTSRKTAAAKPSATANAVTEARPAAPKKAPAVRKTAAKPAVSTPKSAGSDRAEMVRMAAFFRAERRGFTPGYEIEDWLAAEVEVAERVGAVVPKAASD